MANTLFIQSWNLGGISDNRCPQAPASSFPVTGIKPAHTSVTVAHLAIH